VGRLLSGRGFFFGGVCGGLKHAPIHLAWNYQLSHQLIWRGSQALRKVALLQHTT